MTSSNRALALLVGLSVSLQLLTMGARWGAPDERERVEAAERLVDHGSLRLGNGAHTKYPPLTSVLLVPGVLLKRAMPGHGDAWLILPSTLAAAALVAPFHAALLAGGVGTGAAFITSGALAVANPVWPYGKRLYSEPWTALFLMGAVAAALAWRARQRSRHLWMAWLCMAGMVGNNSVVLVLVPVLAGLLAVDRKAGRWLLNRTAALASVGCGTAVVAGWMAINALKFGSPFATGYADGTIPNDVFEGASGFSTLPWIGLHGLLFSAGRGLVVFAPLALLGAWALWRFRTFWSGAALWLFLMGAVPLAVYSGWWSWHGGTCYGPRLLTPFIPAWMLGLGPVVHTLLRRRKALLGLKTLALVTLLQSALASFAGTLFMFSYDQQFWIRDKPFNDFLDVYTPQFSALPRSLRNAWLFPDDVNWAWLVTSSRPVWSLPVEAGTQVVDVELRYQAKRDTWEILDVVGTGTDGATLRPASATVRNAPAANALADDAATTSWNAGTQTAGQGVQLVFAQPVTRVEFTHGKGGANYPRFPKLRMGPSASQLQPATDARVPLGPLSLALPGWLFACLAAAFLLVWLRTARAIF